MHMLSDPQFWWGLGQIILINIVLSCDNAIVVALAVRSLPPRQQKRAVVCGAIAMIVTRIALTILAAEMLKWPFLKIIGAVLLFWIAIRLLAPEEDDKTVESSGNLMKAIRTIWVADLVMSLDNVISVAAAVKGNMSLLILGLVISIPLVVFCATLLVKVMERWPVIITLGAALLGWVAGEMLITDTAWAAWITTRLPWVYLQVFDWTVPWAQIAGAAFVVVAGRYFARTAAK